MERGWWERRGGGEGGGLRLVGGKAEYRKLSLPPFNSTWDRASCHQAPYSCTTHTHTHTHTHTSCMYTLGVQTAYLRDTNYDTHSNILLRPTAHTQTATQTQTGAGAFVYSQHTNKTCTFR